MKIKGFIVTVFVGVFVVFIQAQSSNLTSLYPNSRGWINKYEDLYVKGYIKLKENVKIPTIHEKTLALDRTHLPDLYPTLLYASQISDQYWTKKDKSKLLLFEYFLNVYIQSKGIPSKNLDEFINSLSVFYHADTTKLLTKIVKMDFLELTITHKIQVPRNWFKNPMWYRSQANALLLNEVIQYKNYLTTGIEYSKVMDDSLAHTSIAFVVQQARKDFILNCKEKELFNFYVASARISWKERRLLTEKFENEDTTHFTNGSIKTGEQSTTNYDKCDDQISKWYNESGFKWTRIRRRNGYKFGVEGRETGELFSLWGKSFKTDLTEDERQKVKHQSLDLAMVIPSVIIFIIPGGSVILPFALKYIPALCPSAFRDNSLKVK